MASDRVWTHLYPPETPKEIDLSKYSSVVEVFEKACVRFAGLAAFSNFGHEMTYLELEEKTQDFAAYLQKDLGLKKGDRIALQMPNLLQYPVALFGALRAGLIVVNTNPLYTPREMLYQFKDSGAKAIVIMANFAHNLEKILPQTEIKHVIVTELGDLLGFPKSLMINAAVKYVKKMVPAYHLPEAKLFSEALKKGAQLKFDSVKTDYEDVVVLQYTGGTTGVAKGAMLTNKNLVANMLQIQGAMAPLLRERLEVALLPLPLYHIFCFTLCMSLLNIGAKNILITNPKDLKALVKEISGARVSVMIGVNTLFNALAHFKPFHALDFSTLKVAVAGGMAVQQAVSEKWKQVTGRHLCEGYGLTETSPLLSVNPIDGSGMLGSIGLPASSTELKIMKEDGQEGIVGESGEIWARGPQVMKGYWQRPDETAKVLEGEWFKTGDIGFMTPEGYFKIVDRKKDMILVSGFNVYPNEIEDIVAKCPGVLECAAVGVPHEKSGEAVKVYIVKKDSTLTQELVISHCRENLTSYKVPKFVEFREELPKTNVGKILRRALREEAVKE